MKLSALLSFRAAGARGFALQKRRRRVGSKCASCGVLPFLPSQRIADACGSRGNATSGQQTGRTDLEGLWPWRFDARVGCGVCTAGGETRERRVFARRSDGRFGKRSAGSQCATPLSRRQRRGPHQLIRIPVAHFLRKVSPTGPCGVHGAAGRGVNAQVRAPTGGAADARRHVKMHSEFARSEAFLKEACLVNETPLRRSRRAVAFLSQRRATGVGQKAHCSFC